jgi:hypothetical protein
MVNECLTEFNERATVTITATFTDDDGVAVTPDAATYRIDDEANRTNIQPSTSIGSLDDTVNIVITSDQNFIIRPRSKSEIRTVTVEWDYDTDKHGTAQYRYKLINLYGVVDVPSASVSPSASASPSA